MNDLGGKLRGRINSRAGVSFKGYERFRGKLRGRIKSRAGVSFRATKDLGANLEEG